jgi:hypothetical protein
MAPHLMKERDFFGNILFKNGRGNIAHPYSPHPKKK